jgi:hypothetical protein
MNKLFYGNNLDVMRKFIRDETGDFCYIDPPFNSKRNYNQIYNNIGTEDRAQAPPVHRHMDMGRPMLRRDSVEQERRANAAVNRSH